MTTDTDKPTDTKFEGKMPDIIFPPITFKKTLGAIDYTAIFASFSILAMFLGNALMGKNFTLWQIMEPAVVAVAATLVFQFIMRCGLLGLVGLVLAVPAGIVAGLTWMVFKALQGGVWLFNKVAGKKAT